MPVVTLLVMAPELLRTVCVPPRFQKANESLCRLNVPPLRLLSTAPRPLLMLPVPVQAMVLELLMVRFDKVLLVPLVRFTTAPLLIARVPVPLMVPDVQSSVPDSASGPVPERVPLERSMSLRVSRAAWLKLAEPAVM